MAKFYIYYPVDKNGEPAIFSIHCWFRSKPFEAQNYSEARLKGADIANTLQTSRYLLVDNDNDRIIARHNLSV